MSDALFMNTHIVFSYIKKKKFCSLSLSFCLFQEFLVIIAFSLAVPHIISFYSFPLQRAMQMHPPLTLSIISNILLNTQTPLLLCSFFGCIRISAFIRAIPSTCVITIQFNSACMTSIISGHNTSALVESVCTSILETTNEQTALVCAALCLQYN